MPLTISTATRPSMDESEADTPDVIAEKSSVSLRAVSIPHVPGYARNLDWMRATSALPEEAAGTSTGPTRVIY